MILSIHMSLVALMMSACTGGSLFVVNLPTHFSNVQVKRDIAYGPQPWQKLDIYGPADMVQGSSLPVIMFFHGGRWTFGQKEQYAFVANTFAKEGYIVIVPDYSKYPDVRFPAFVEEAALAVSWAYDHSVDYGGNPKSLNVVGHSSGAHIGALVATDPQYLAAYGKDRSIINAYAGLAGPYDFEPKEEDLKELFGPPDRYPLMQIPTFIDGKQSPMLLLHGAGDEIVGYHNVENVQKKIQATGGDVEAILYPGIDHTEIVGALSWVLDKKAPVKDDIITFFEKYNDE